MNEERTNGHLWHRYSITKSWWPRLENFQSDNSNLTIMNPSRGSVDSLLAATVSEIMTGSTRSGVWNITNRKLWKLKHDPLALYVSTFFYLWFLIVKEKHKTMSENIRNCNKFSCVAFLKYNLRHLLHSLSRVVVPTTLHSISVNAHFTRFL